MYIAWDGARDNGGLNDLRRRRRRRRDRICLLAGIRSVVYVGDCYLVISIALFAGVSVASLMFVQELDEFKLLLLLIARCCVYETCGRLRHVLFQEAWINSTVVGVCIARIL